MARPKARAAPSLRLQIVVFLLKKKLKRAKQNTFSILKRGI